MATPTPTPTTATAAAAATKAYRIGIIVGSQRVVRVAPQVAAFVLDTIKAAKPPQSDIKYDVIDLAAQNLPMFDEPGITMQIKSPSDYVHSHTRTWSHRISACDAFILVSSQRNWGIPAELKNAIDFLFNEWVGKPAMLVTYGGHGGTQCAAQLKTVLTGVRMKVLERSVNMSFPSAEFREKAFRGEALGLDAREEAGPWAEHRAEIVDLWEELVKTMVEA